MAAEKQGHSGWLSHWPVQSKMMLALGLVLAVFVIGTVAALVSQDESDQALRLRSETYETIVQVDQLIRVAVDQQLTLRGYVINATPGILSAHDHGREDFASRIEALLQRTREDPLQHTHLVQVSTLMDRYWETVADPVLQWMEHAATRGQAAAIVASGQDGRYINEMRRELEDMQATENERLVTRTRAAERSAEFTRRVLFSLLVGGVGLGVLALAIARIQITNPLVHLSGLMERLAAQDLAIRVPDQERGDEVGAIARALEVFKRMAQATAAETWVKSGVTAISARLYTARDYQQFANFTLAELAPRIDAPVARFYRFDPASGELVRKASLGDVETTATPTHLRLGEGPAGLCARLRAPDVQARHYSRPAGGAPADTAVLRPIVLGDQLLGVIELGRAGKPEVRHERLLDELMPMLALSLENLTHAIQLQASEQELQKANEALHEKSEAAHHQATHDPLTRVPNRLLFVDRLEQAVSRGLRSGELFALCYIDIDGFKPVNDRHGHLAGDLLLCAIAARLQETLRRSDTVARLGGDEFVLLMGDPESEGQALAAAERLGRRIAEPYILNSPELTETLVIEIGASIGLALFPGDARGADALMKAADAAMYVAKHSGKNRCVRAADLAAAPAKAP